MNEHAHCVDTPKTKLPQWLLDSEYFQVCALASSLALSLTLSPLPSGFSTLRSSTPTPPPPVSLPQDPKQGAEGAATGVAGTNPAGWKTYGLGLPPPAPVPTP